MGMFQQYFKDHHLLVLPVIGLVICFVSFIAVLGYVIFGLRRKGLLERMASLPLQDDNALPRADSVGRGNRS